MESQQYALFSSDRSQLARLIAALPADLPVFATDRWRAFEQRAPTASCLIVALRWLRDGFALGVDALNTGPAWHRPLVVVTSRDADNARQLKDMRVDDVVWFGDVERELWRAVRAAESRDLLERIAIVVQESDHLPPVLRTALAHACRSPRPVPNVSALARAVGRDRRTLWRLWRMAHQGEPPLRLEDFLSWLLLIRAARLKSAHSGWTQVARHLRVHQQKLSRAATRLAGSALRELGHESAPFTRRFAADALAPLVRRETLDDLQ